MSKTDQSKRKRSQHDSELSPRKPSRSISSHSSDSVSTISTSRSRSPSRSPPRRRRSDSRENKRRFSNPGNVSADRPKYTSSVDVGDRRGDDSYWQEPIDDSRNRTRQRRRSRPVEESPERSRHYRDRPRTRSRSPSASRPSERTRSRSRSPYRRGDVSLDRKKGAYDDVNTKSKKRSRVRERSLSPYSKRLALTQARNEKA